MNILNVAICEDMPSDAALLRCMIGESGVSCRIFTYETGEAFLENFQPGFFQLILLDIYFDGRPEHPRTNAATGLEVAQKIRESDNNVWLTFTTISKDHMAAGYPVKADRYLLKPLKAEEVISLLHRAAEHFESINNEIIVTVDRKPCGVRIRDIMYAEVLGKQSLIHTPDEIIATYTKIDDIAKMLDFTPFLRCYRSFVVNMDYIERIDRDFIMVNGDTVYIGRNQQWKMRQAYRNYVVHLAREGGE